MKVSELMSLLSDVDEDAEVYFYLGQYRTSLRYNATNVSAFSTEAGDCVDPEDADEVYLHGPEAGYAPRNATNDFL